jgi:ABC-type antimicrobial peptide transport system permease subunit
MDKPELANTFRIVGMVGDAKFAGWGLRRPAMPMFYVPLAQYVNYPKGDMLERVEVRSHYIGGLMLTTNAAPGALEPVITKILADLDPNLTITSVRTMREQVALRFDQDRAVASLAGLFGGVALLLAAVGLYGVTAYGVAQRRNEIGIRMALGADRGRVVGLVLRGTAARVGAGLALGVPLAIGAGRLLQAQLYGVSNWDPVALGVAVGALAVCASVAAIIPARRAASIPAVEALRAE